MGLLTVVLIVVFGLLIVAAGVVVFLRYWKLRGTRLIECPENGEHAAVHLRAAKAAFALDPDPVLRLHDCTRWPEHADCGQECITQIEVAPDGCRVRSMIEEWYRDHPCVLCGREFPHLSWKDHKPALIDAERRSVQWSEVPAQDLPQFFQDHFPICWDCHVVEKVYHDHPELVTERPGKWKHTLTRAHGEDSE